MTASGMQHRLELQINSHSPQRQVGGLWDKPADYVLGCNVTQLTDRDGNTHIKLSSADYIRRMARST